MNNQEQEKEEEFFAVLKLVSGEEIFARVQPLSLIHI